MPSVGVWPGIVHLFPAATGHGRHFCGECIEACMEYGRLIVYTSVYAMIAGPQDLVIQCL